jgi:hypothetical protein
MIESLFGGMLVEKSKKVSQRDFQIAGVKSRYPAYTLGQFPVAFSIIYLILSQLVSAG